MARLLPLVACFTFTTIFCIHYLFAKEILVYTDAMTLACLRGLLGGALLIILYHRPLRGVLNRRMIPRMIVPAFFGVILNQILFLEGLKSSTPLHAAVLANTIPVFSTLLAVIFGFEKRSNLILAGILFGSACSSFYVLKSASLSGSGLLVGDLLILGNVLSIAVSYLFFKKWLARTDSRGYTAFALTFAGFFFLSFKWQDVLEFIPVLQTNSRILYFTLYEIFAATSLAYLLNFYALTKLHVSTVTAFIFLQPIITETVAGMMGQYTTPLSWTDFLLFAGIVGSVCLIMWEKNRAQRAAAKIIT